MISATKPLTRPQATPAAGNAGPQQTAQQPANDAQQQKQLEPAEAVAIKELLSTLGYTKYDPRVVYLLMDMAYRTTSDILREAEAINVAAGGTGADLSPQDLALAAAQHARRQPQPPTLQELHALAAKVNAQPLTGPSDKQHGIKLPPVADCLLSQNYQLRQAPKAAPPAAKAPPPGPPRQHFAVKQQHKIAMQIPQQLQPKPEPAADSTEPFPPPAYQQQPQQQELPDPLAFQPLQEQQQAVHGTDMEMEFEEV